MDQQNNAMIAKLMTRKKSYERMLSLEDTLQGNRLAAAQLAVEKGHKKIRNVGEGLTLPAAAPNRGGAVTEL